MSKWTRPVFLVLLGLVGLGTANIIVIENFNEATVETFESIEEESSLFIPCPEYFRLDINLTYSSISTNIRRYEKRHNS